MSTETQRAKFVSIEQAKTALDDMDDYALMTVGVDAAGPRGQLERFIEQQASQAAELAALKADIATKDAAIRAMLAALEESVDLVENDYNTDWRHGMPTRQAQLDGKYELLEAHRAAIEQGKSAAMQTKEES